MMPFRRRFNSRLTPPTSTKAFQKHSQHKQKKLYVVGLVLLGLIAPNAIQQFIMPLRAVAWTTSTDVAGWFGDNNVPTGKPVNNDFPQPISAGNFSSVGRMLGGSGLTLSNITLGTCCTVFRSQSVTATSYATAVTNNEYIYSSLTVSSSSPSVRFSAYRFNQPANGGTSYNSSGSQIVLALYDVTNNTITQISAPTTLNGTTNGKAIPLTAQPVLVPGRTYELRQYFYSSGSVITNYYVDNQVISAQVNQAPTATSDSFSTQSPSPVTFTPLSNDTDPENDTLTITQINGTNIASGGSASVTGGTVTLNANGSLTYQPNTGYSGSPTFQYTISDGNNNTATGNISGTVTAPAPLDYGDAPDSYGTLLASGGARHTTSTLFLGAGVTSETDGQPNATATGDANDDGVTFSPTLGANYSTLIQAGVSNQATVVSSGTGFVNAWVDYNNNGVFDTGEQILTNQAVVAGNNTLNFNIPNTALHGSTFARFRLSPTSVASPSPTGLITGGEVEDYQVNIAAPVPDGASCSTTGLLNGGFEAPVQGANSFLVQSEDNIPGWNTTATDKQIETWSTGFQGVPSFEGNQFAELNANQVAALYQDIATVPGATITYQFAHRARSSNSSVVVDVASVQAGPSGALVTLKTISTDSSNWVVYRGTYVVPTGQYITRFQFNSISSGAGSNSFGNFLDAVQFSTNNCVTPISPPTIDLDGNNSAATGNNYQNTFTIGGSAVAAADTDTVVTDDQTNITRAIFTLTNTPDGANESLTIDPTAGGTVTGVSVDVAYDSTAGSSTTGRLTIKGSATLADYQKVIATLKYSNTKASPTLSDRIINVEVIDSDKAISNTAVSTIKISTTPVCLKSAADGSYATSGLNKNSLWWLNWECYDESIASTSAGQPFTFTLPDGSTMTLAVKKTGPKPVTTTTTSPATSPFSTFGTSAQYAGITGKPAFYNATNPGSGIQDWTETLTNIVVKDKAGNTRNYTFVSADAENTNQVGDPFSNVGLEQLKFGTNGTNWSQVELLNTASGAPTNILSGLNTANATWTANGNNNGSLIISTNNPSQVSLSAAMGGTPSNFYTTAQGGVFGIGIPKVTLIKNIVARVAATDQFTTEIDYTAPTVVLGTVTSANTATTTTTGSISVLPGNIINLKETMAAGSSSALSLYDSSIACTNANTTTTVLPSGAGTSFNFTPQIGDDITCTITNKTQVPNVLLVKRITAVNGSATNGSIDLGTYDPETDTNSSSYAYDKNITQAGLMPPSSTNWPNTTGAASSTFLLGARNGGTTKTGDEIDYTIYFLSTGNAAAKGVTICDRIPRYQAFVPDAFNSLAAAPNTGTAASPGDRGIAVFQGSSTLPDTTYGYTNIGDGDAARYYSPGSPLPSACTQPALAEDNGTIVVNLGDVLNATAPGTPKESYGFLRFRAKVK